MWIKLAIAGAIFASLMGAFGSFIYAQREIGAATVRAELAEQQKEAEALNAQRALEGEAYALKLLGAAEKRQRVAESNLATLQLSRREESDARAKIDPEHARWSVELVPDWDAERLRLHAESFAATASRNRVPGQSALSLDASAAADSTPVDESWVTGIRRKFAGLFGSGAQGK